MREDRGFRSVVNHGGLHPRSEAGSPPQEAEVPRLEHEHDVSEPLCLAWFDYNLLHFRRQKDSGYEDNQGEDSEEDDDDQPCCYT